MGFPNDEAHCLVEPWPWRSTAGGLLVVDGLLNGFLTNELIAVIAPTGNAQYGPLPRPMMPPLPPTLQCSTTVMTARVGVGRRMSETHRHESSLLGSGKLPACAIDHAVVHLFT